MAYPAYSEVVLLAVKIIAKLSLSTSPSTLVTLMQASAESERILGGFVKIMSTDATENVAQAEEYASRMTGAGAPVVDSFSESLEQAMRLAALDLLIQDTETSRPYPNIAHFLSLGTMPISKQFRIPMHSAHSVRAYMSSSTSLTPVYRDSGGKSGREGTTTLRHCLSLFQKWQNGAIASSTSSVFIVTRQSLPAAIYALARTFLLANWHESPLMLRRFCKSHTSRCYTATARA